MLADASTKADLHAHPLRIQLHYLAHKPILRQQHDDMHICKAAGSLPRPKHYDKETTMYILMLLGAVAQIN